MDSLIEKFFNKEEKLSTLLFLARGYGIRWEDNVLLNFIEKELYGYSIDDKIPDYRNIRGEIFGDISDIKGTILYTNRKIDFSKLSKDVGRDLDMVCINEGILFLESLNHSAQKLVKPLSNELILLFDKRVNANNPLLRMRGGEHQVSILLLETVFTNIRQELVRKFQDSNARKQKLDLKPPSSTKIYFSYAWGEERERIVDELYESLKKDGFELIRDKVKLGYKGFISKFIEDLGQGRIVIIAYSDKYLKSEYCMYELYELFRNSMLNKNELLKKILPINIENIQLNSPVCIEHYLKYWSEKEKEWASFMSRQVERVSTEQQDRYGRVKRIALELGRLLDFLSDINTLTVSQISNNNFFVIKQEINAMSS